MGLSCMGPLICECFSINVLENFFGDLQFEKMFYLPSFIIRIQYIMHRTYKICVDQLFVIGKAFFWSTVGY